MARLIPLGEAVTRGEQKMLAYLQRTLPDDWVVFGNAQVTTGEFTREVDAIVVGNRCVWVVDEKGFGGRITGDEHIWILADGSARERVLNNVLHTAKMVKGKLEATNPLLAHIWVEGLILFPRLGRGGAMTGRLSNAVYLVQALLTDSRNASHALDPITSLKRCRRDPLFVPTELNGKGRATSLS